MHEIITSDYYEGQGCTCYATSANECGCEGADWTPVEVYKLRKDAKQLADRLTALELHSTSELARLELERDDALSQIVQAECRAERFCQERDEARIDAQKSKAYKRVLKETNLRQTERIRYLEGATNHACGTPLSVALRERDEARDAIVGWENKWKCAIDMAARAELERDEALKCAKEYYVEFIRNASSDNKVSKPNPLNPFYKY
jgi:hypothetical protein